MFEFHYGELLISIISFATLLKPHFGIRGFPVSLLHICKTDFYKNTSGVLLLDFLTLIEVMMVMMMTMKEILIFNSHVYQVVNLAASTYNLTCSVNSNITSTVNK